LCFRKPSRRRASSISPSRFVDALPGELLYRRHPFDLVVYELGLYTETVERLGGAASLVAQQGTEEIDGGE
jgi:hypothetical protein